MAIVGGFDLHRRRITFEYLDTVSGEVSRGRVAPADREHLRAWLGRLEGQGAAFAVEACTGWRFVVEELERAGAQAHLAEPLIRPRCVVRSDGRRQIGLTPATCASC